MNKSDSITKLAPALCKALAALKNPALDKTNPHFRSKYATLAMVRDTVTPVLGQHGLAVTQHLIHAEGGMACETVILHDSGEWMSSVIMVPAAKQDAQGYGSAATYARRYALMAVCGVVGDEDDDGNAASTSVNNKGVPIGKGAIPATAGAWEALSDEVRGDLGAIAHDIIDALSKDRDYDALELYRSVTDADHKVALWTRFDAKQRARIKEAGKKADAA